MCTTIGSGVDFDSNPITITFAAGEVSKIFSIPVTCDKIVEGTEKFDISLILPSNNSQLRTGRDRSQGRIKDSTGKWWNISEYIGDDRWINFAVVVNFNQSSYEVMEDSSEVIIVIELSQPSSQTFEVIISLIDITAKCT